MTFTLRCVESLSPAKGQGGTTTVDVAFGQQRIIPNAIDFLRSNGVSIGARGEASYAGSLHVQVTGTGFERIFAGARTSSRSPAGGEFGVFYPAIGPGQEFSDLAYVLGLKADFNNRSNVAVLHAGTGDSGPITVELQVLDGSEGQGRGAASLGEPESRRVDLRIRRTAGTAPWYAYGVINDGGQPGQRIGDGSYVPGAQP